MSMAYIREHYGVPAKRGARVRFNDPHWGPIEGVITSAHEGHIRMRPDGQPVGTHNVLLLHPTWCVEYLDD